MFHFKNCTIMNFEVAKTFFKINAYRFRELGDTYAFYRSEYFANIAYLSIIDNMLSPSFLRFLLNSELNFAIFPAFDTDIFNYNIQIEFDYAK